jgi:hypothetical protein
VSNVVNSVTSFLGIRSPSTVFAGIGRNMGEGLGIGFEEEMAKVAKDMQNAIPTDFDIDASVRGGFAGAYAAGANPNGGAGTVTQNISITSPKALSEKEAAREFRNMSRRLALGIS